MFTNPNLSMNNLMHVVMIAYLQTEYESNEPQNEETKQHVDDGENQVVVWLYLTNSSIGNRWLLSHYNLQEEKMFILYIRL